VKASWEVAGVDAYYEYSTSVTHFGNGIPVVEGVFVLDSTDPLCSSGPGTSAVTDDTTATDDAFSSHDDRMLMETESEDQPENDDESMDGDDDDMVDTVQRDLQRYHASSSFSTRGGPRVNFYGRGPRAQQTGRRSACSFTFLRCLIKLHIFTLLLSNL
jgi:hypothetical protein